MKLILHAGTHKTATTGFQMMCAANRDLLREHGVFYPLANGFYQHGQAIHELQRGDDTLIRQTLSHPPENGSATVTLVSAEAMETCLTDHRLAQKIESLAAELGFDEIEWMYVCRDPGEYVLSLYAQLAHFNARMPTTTVNFIAYVKTILRYGYFSWQTPDTNQSFVFDYARFLSEFRDSIGGQLRSMTKTDFTEDFPGCRFLSGYLTPSAIDALRASQAEAAKANVRLDIIQAERAFSLAAVNLKHDQESFEQHAQLIDDMTRLRLHVHNAHAKEAAELIRSNFPMPDWFGSDSD